MSVNETDGNAPEFRTFSARQLLVIGWIIVGTVFGGLAAWSILAPFEGAVIAQGQISVESNRQAVQHLEGGIVDEIFVREFDTVEKGQPLLRLDSTQINARLQSLEARLFELLGEEARLNAELNSAETLALRPGLAFIKDAEELEGILEEQSSLMRTRRDGIRKQLSILQQRIAQNEVRISGMEREIETKDVQIGLAGDEIGRLEQLYERGHATLTRILALKREQARVEGDREALISEIAATKVRIGEAEIEQQQLERNFREEVQTRLRDTKTQIAELLEERASLTDRMERTVISAPSSGRVIGVQAHTVGGVITQSQPVMYIVPQDDKLVATIQIQPIDIDKVAVGQPATLRFTSFNQNETPVVKSTVEKISADVFSISETGRTYYEAVIEIDTDDLSTVPTALLPGMPVEAMLTTERRDVLSYLIKPLTDSFSRTFRE